MTSPIRFLMCPPDFYDVDYVINPWMEGNVHRASRERAMAQWQQLFQILHDRAQVDLIRPREDWPDMVFTANAGLVLGDAVVLSRFLHKERQGEAPYFKQWFAEQGYAIHELPPDLPFEGAGDALLDREGRWLWAAYGFRSELDAHPHLARWLDIEVLSLRLIDRRFYHLDTCFCPLHGGYLLYYPAAFDEYSNRLIEARVEADKRIVVSEADAINFACNAVNVEHGIVLHAASEALKNRLENVSFSVWQTPLTEFMKAGGGAKCLTLRVTEPVREEIHAGATVANRIIGLDGHLLDSGLLSRVLDAVVAGGGSFQVLDFDLGEQRQSISRAQVKVSAPSAEVLENIAGQLIELGAVPLPDEVRDARLEEVAQTGVAPDDFYVSTIYPTEVRVHGQWVRVTGQRMDATIVVGIAGLGAGGDSDGGPLTARCKLLRDLQVGERVVVGVEGIRTVRRAEARAVRPAPDLEEFSFMGSGVSSERRVELVVEQIAWELRRLRARGGKAVVVADPVVIHTGGGEHLARLIREGYVQALLGGKAIAVHDIEQALLGTSLGVDVQRGTAVHGGHRHHLKAINTVRRCGGIAPAVEQGVLKSGVFYECVRRGVPFALAGSIRDDGPLPETQMDLIVAQAEYARLLQGADMIVMLSSMLHSIGVGNMTTAGVKLVCVDINPAVVTKLSDRGSLESVGVVTDVGLFLSLLVRQLARTS
jgi:lysine-ketoglutarate reductase/saccharopine dehydrogenase-like protein (TIGR00300 family)